MTALEYTYDLLTELSGEAQPFCPQTEEQLLARIDHSLDQIEEGEFQDAEVVERELLMGIE